jgi:hypothetical protein
MVGKQVRKPNPCIERIRDSKVRVTDPGTARRAILLNPDRVQVRRIRMDHCLAPVGEVAADFVVSKPNLVDVIVELKGKNVDHAVDQIESTLTFWRRHAEYKRGQPIGAWIVCAEYPRASLKVARYRTSFRARGSILLFSTHNGDEKPFSDFAPKQT